MGRNYSLWRSAPFTIIVLLALSAALLGSGCRATLNSTSIPIPPGWDPLNPGGGGNNNNPVNITSFTIVKPGGGDIHAGDQLQLTVTFTAGTSPFVLGYLFEGNSVDPTSIPVMPRTVTSSPDQFNVTVLASAAPGVYTVDVGIADSRGNVDSDSASFTVVATGGGPNPTNRNPTIAVDGDDATCTVTVTVSDPDGDDLTVDQAAPAGLSPLDGSQSVAGGNGSVVFHYAPSDLLAGGSGTITFTVTDGKGGTASLGANLFCAGVVLEPDTLYAIPTRETASAGSPLTIIVATGDPAEFFEYMNGVRVTFDAASGVEYVDDSFNVGAIGGDADAVDGFWTSMAGLDDGEFLLAPDSFYAVQDAGGGLSALDFNITPLGGSNISSGSGALFNFQVTFANPGTYALGFQEFNVVDRTYYNDHSQTTIHHWGDLTNAHAGIANQVTVTP